jgi:hypothetical protein
MNNNDIFKKLRVALMLRDDQIIEILELVDFRMSKGEIGNIFRSQDHPDFMECGDQVLRNFLNGLVIHLRGTKENPKNPNEVLAKHQEYHHADYEKDDFFPQRTSEMLDNKRWCEHKLELEIEPLGTSGMGEVRPLLGQKPMLPLLYPIIP